MKCLDVRDGDSIQTDILLPHVLGKRICRNMLQYPGDHNDSGGMKHVWTIPNSSKLAPGHPSDGKFILSLSGTSPMKWLGWDSKSMFAIIGGNCFPCFSSSCFLHIQWLALQAGSLAYQWNVLPNWETPTMQKTNRIFSHARHVLDYGGGGNVLKFKLPAHSSELLERTGSFLLVRRLLRLTSLNSHWIVKLLRSLFNARRPSKSLLLRLASMRHDLESIPGDDFIYRPFHQGILTHVALQHGQYPKTCLNLVSTLCFRDKFSTKLPYAYVVPSPPPSPA